jgi:4-hydroxyphenylpyruvate dioxygenase-like putative hemolysin
MGAGGDGGLIEAGPARLSMQQAPPSAEDVAVTCERAANAVERAWFHVVTAA